MKTVLFEGHKFFWRTRSTVDVLIVEHKPPHVLELIAYEPKLDIEAPRLYVNKSVLKKNLNHHEIDAKVRLANQNGLPTTEKFVDELWNAAIVELLLETLLLASSDQNAPFQVDWRHCSSDDDDGKSWICQKPDGLVPHQTRHYRHLMEGVAEQAMQEMELVRKGLAADIDRANKLEAAAQDQLDICERWRIPIVVIKVHKGKTLRPRDSKIFKHVQRNIKTAEDVARINQALNIGRNHPPSVHLNNTTIKSSATPPTLPPRANSSLFAETASSVSKVVTVQKPPAAGKKTKSNRKLHSSSPRKLSKRGFSGLGDDVEQTLEPPVGVLAGLAAAIGASIKASFGPQTQMVRPYQQDGQETPLCTTDDTCPVVDGQQHQAVDNSDKNMTARQLSALGTVTQVIAGQEAVIGAAVLEQRVKPTKRGSALSSILMRCSIGAKDAIVGVIQALQAGSARNQVVPVD